MKITQTQRTILVRVSVACLLCVLTLSQPCAAQNVASPVTVVVMDPPGAVLVGAEVRVMSVSPGEVLKTMHTDKNGRASAALLPGEYYLFVTVGGFRSATTKISADNTPQTVAIRLSPLPPEQQGGSPDVGLPPQMTSAQTVKLKGQVMDRSGATVANAHVLLIDLNALEIQRTSSDDKGAFEFNGLSRTPYEVKAACQGFVTGSAKVFELVDSVGFIDPNPPPFLTVNVKIILSVKSTE